MIAKIAVLFAVVAVAYAGVIAGPPASTTLLANTIPIQTLQTIQLASPAIHQVAAVRTVAAAPTIVAAAPTVIQTGHKIVQTVEPVEQHGYRIVY